MVALKLIKCMKDGRANFSSSSFQSIGNSSSQLHLSFFTGASQQSWRYCVSESVPSLTTYPPNLIHTKTAVLATAFLAQPNSYPSFSRRLCTCLFCTSTMGPQAFHLS